MIASETMSSTRRSLTSAPAERAPSPMASAIGRAGLPLYQALLHELIDHIRDAAGRKQYAIRYLAQRLRPFM